MRNLNIELWTWATWTWLPMQETQEAQKWSLAREDPREEETAAHTSTGAWRIHGQRSLLGCSPRGRTESDTTKRPSTRVGTNSATTSLLSQVLKNYSKLWVFLVDTWGRGGRRQEGVVGPGWEDAAECSEEPVSWSTLESWSLRLWAGGPQEPTLL